MGPWTTAHLAERKYDDVMSLAAAVAMDRAGVPVDLPYGLTVVECGHGTFWTSSVPAVARDAGVAKSRDEIERDAHVPVVVDNRRFALDWDHVSQGRRIMVAVEHASDLRPDDVRDLLPGSRAYRLRMDPPFLRAFLQAWYGVSDEVLDDLGVENMRGTPRAWLEFGVKFLASALFGKAPIRQALAYVADKLDDLDPPGEDKAVASVDQHHDHDEPPAAKPLGTVAASVVRRLSEMTGFGEDATRWGMDLARDLRDWESGEIGWADVDKGLLLSGPPGCGKTTYARALALECEVDLVVTGYDQWHGTGTGDNVSKGLGKLFAEWRKRAKLGPVIVLWDEADSVGVRGGNAQNDSWFAPMINAWLAFLDGAEPRDGVVVIAATNYPDRIDAALRRPGRLDRDVALPRPDPAALRGILAAHLRVDAEAPGMDEAARAVRGSTPAEVELLVREARRHARSARRQPTPADVAATAVAMRPTSAPEVDRRVAIHEAAHAVAALAVGIGVDWIDADRGIAHVRYASVQGPRDWLDAVVVGLAAGAAEVRVFGYCSSGREHDLAMATAKVVSFHLAFGWGSTLSYVGEYGSAVESLSEAQRDRVEATLRAEYERADALMGARLHDVRWLAKALLERRYLTGDEVRAVLRDFRPLMRACERRHAERDAAWGPLGEEDPRMAA